MSDFISRQAAIEAVEHITSSMSVCVNTDECHGMKRMQRQAVIELANLPSAHPEIIRCKDCMHYGTYYRGNESKPVITHLCKWCLDRTMEPDDYCSHAERRTDDADAIT